MEEIKPYLSIIMASRNDDYQGNALSRLQMVVNNLIDQAKQYNLRAELIIVDWNPPSDKPLLKDAVFLPDDLGPSIVRFITVPSSIHKTYRCSDKIKIITVAALNVGIRRAEGEFIWTTNSDLLFSDELMRFLSSEKLEKGRFYRAFRYSVREDVLKLKDAPLKERLDFCQNNIVFIHPRNTVSIHGLPDHPILQTATGGDFIVFSKEHWHLLHGYVQLNNLGGFTDWLLCYICYLAGLKEKILDDSMRVYHIDHARHAKQREEFSKGIINTLRYKIFPKIDDNNKLKILARKINNLKNKTLDLFTNIFYRLFGRFIRKYGPPGIWDRNLRYLYWEFHKLLLDMLKGKRSYVYNDDNWGLPNENFAEFVIKNES